MKKAFGVGAICVAFTAAVGTPPLFAQDQKGPLAALPSKPGPHVEKIRALGDNEWLNLGSPAADPKWGKAGGVRGERKPSPPPRTSVALSSSARESTATSSPMDTSWTICGSTTSTSTPGFVSTPERTRRR